jgi:hypothetical protein
MRNDILFFILVGSFIVSCFLCPETLNARDKQQGFDYSDYAAVLKNNVDDNGMVNYRQLNAGPQSLKSFASELITLNRKDFEKWKDNEKIAFWLNAYNALTLKVIIDNYPIKSSFFKSLIYPDNSIRQIEGVWDEIKFNVMGQKLTLGHIEHKILRVKFDKPRIHMAMVCAAMGCPPLRNEPYTGEKLDEQLDDQTNHFLANPEKFKIDKAGNNIYLSPIFKWFGKDFINKYAPENNIGRHNKKESAALNFIASYLENSQKKFVLSGGFRIKYLDYDWSLNKQKRKK